MRIDSEMIITIFIIGIPFLIVLYKIFYTKMNGIEIKQNDNLKGIAGLY